MKYQGTCMLLFSWLTFARSQPQQVQHACAGLESRHQHGCITTMTQLHHRERSLGACGLATACNCDFARAYRCGQNIHKCLSCGISPQSPECTACLRGIGSSCCDCVGVAVGLENKISGQKVCDICHKMLQSSSPQMSDLTEVMCGDDNPSCEAMIAKFHKWKKQHDKQYSTESHHQKAFSNFQESEKRINAHNELGRSWTVGHNAFSDLTPEEFEIMFSHPLPNRTANNPAALQHVPTPKSVDWVKLGAVTPIQDQGTCNSCVSFSTVGAIEGHYAIATGNLTSLSAQELVDCNTPAFGGKGDGCTGGFVDQTFTFVSNFQGLCTAQDYPYTGTQGKCRGTKGVGPSCTPVAAVKGFVDVMSEKDLLKAVSLGPVSAGIASGSNVFHNYKSGVIDSPACGTYLSHAILIVGFGTDEATGLDYWKIKNTWGTTWGEDGYARLVRGKNMCGIASYPPSYPTGVGPAKVQASQSSSSSSSQTPDLTEIMCGDDNPRCDAMVNKLG